MTTLNSDTWVVIPARGGSVGVPRKNVRVIGGRPLIAHSIATAQQAVPGDHVVVVTDDEEIKTVAEGAGAIVVLEEQATPAGETLDSKIVRNLPTLRTLGASENDIVLTVQPTSPLLPPSAIVRGAELLRAGARSVMTVTEDRHLRWGLDDSGTSKPLYAARVNRQQLPMEFRETGGVIGARLGDIEVHGTRVIEPVALIELTTEEAIDIDSFADLYAAAHLMSRLCIAIRVDAAPELGMGHAYRALSVATELARHDLRIFTSREKPLGGQFFARTPYRHVELPDPSSFLDEVQALQPDLVVLDILDTDAELIDGLRERAPGVRILTFEDQGSGAEKADLVVAEFVPVPAGSRASLTGITNAILAPAFDTVAGPVPFRDEVEHVLVLFGGTDPSGLAERALASLTRVGFEGHVTAVRGLGAAPLQAPPAAYDLEILTDVRHMPSVIAQADVAFTSAGRTIIELASLGVPAICMAQNVKELTHTHATRASGVDMLGLGAEVSDVALDDAVRLMIGDREHRLALRDASLATLSGRSNHRTLGRIFDLLGLDPFPNL